MLWDIFNLEPLVELGRIKLPFLVCKTRVMLIIRQPHKLPMPKIPTASFDSFRGECFRERLSASLWYPRWDLNP